MLREEGYMHQGTDNFSINFDYNLNCQYAGEVNANGEAHGEGVGTCEEGTKTVTGTFMRGQPHGVILVQRPDGAESTYEVRGGVRHGKETYRNVEHDLIWNTTWKPANDGTAHFNSGKQADDNTAFFDADGTYGTADDDDWREYM